jgi:hypothetical protein
VREEALAAAIVSAEHILQTADSQTTYDLANLLGQIASDHGYELLWRMVDRRIGLGAALFEIARRRNPADLPRLGNVLASSSASDNIGSELYGLPSQLREQFGDAAFPYLEHALEASPYRPVQINCARELINADRLIGLAFALRAVQGRDRVLSMNLGRIVRERFLELLGADDKKLIEFLERRLK